MPMYDYQCAKCCRIFEAFHSRMDDEPEDCQHEDCDGRGRRIPHTSQKLKQPRWVPPPKAQKKFGQHVQAHRPAKWR